jgi:hypothetical protein
MRGRAGVCGSQLDLAPSDWDGSALEPADGESGARTRALCHFAGWQAMAPSACVQAAEADRQIRKGARSRAGGHSSRGDISRLVAAGPWLR